MSSGHTEPYIHSLEKLGWDAWRSAMFAHLREKELFDTARSRDPDVDAPTTLETINWTKRTSKAAGIIFKYIGIIDTHFVDPAHDDNAYLIMEDLRKTKADQVSANRFNAYMRVLGIKKGEDSTYQAVIQDVVKAIRHMKEL